MSPESAKIRVLPDLVMKRIAAGEVVERPASVVKELLENSLDAGSTAISLVIQNGGADLIQVIDNGCGMSEEDVLLCSQRHATSKIFNAEDLDSIETLGFRGEALASISSIARLEIITCREDDAESSQVYFEDGVIGEMMKAAPRRGTIITVKDLFYNVPARRKFLKTTSTELRHIILIFRRIAVAFPEIEFELILDEDKTYDLRKSDRKTRILDLIAKSSAANFIPVEKEIAGISLKGLIGRPGTGRRSRDNQMFFLNNRFITDRSLSHALISSYGSRLARNEYPDFFIFLEIDPARVDVNVHPTKDEVRFMDAKLVYDSVRRAVLEGLKQPAVVPDLQLIPGPATRTKFPRVNTRDEEDMGQLTLEIQRPSVGNSVIRDFRSEQRDRPSLWQVHNKYILTQIKSGLTLIDQHVAHERVLYEKALLAINDKRGVSQQLLFPQSIQMSPADYSVLMEMLPYLQQIGFGLKEFGKNTVIVESVPVTMKNGTEKELLLEMIDLYKDNQHDSNDIYDKIASVYACKAAIKAGEPMTLSEMASLIDQLFSTKEPYFCPHGRPVVVNLSIEEIDKRFGR